MKRSLKTVLVIGVVVAATLATASAVWAWGPGGRGGRIGGPAGGQVAIAEALGMSVEDLQAALEGGDTVADLAEAEGVELADVKAAAEAANEAAARDRIEQAVEDGKLSREQANWMLQGLDEGYTRGPGRRPGFAPGPEGGGLDAAAEALGLTVDELQLQLWGGRTLADLAELAGVELETVQDAMRAEREDAMRERLAQAVEDGRLTQEQADQMIERIESGFKGEMGPRGRGRLPGGCGPLRGAPMGQDGMQGQVGPRGFGGRPPAQDGADFGAPRLRSAEPA